MVYLGYILPPKNQKVYNNDVALALANYQKDLLNTSFEKLEPEQQQKIVEAVSNGSSSLDVAKIIDTLMNRVERSMAIRDTREILKNNFETGPIGQTPLEAPSTPTQEKPLQTGIENNKVVRTMTPKERAITSAEEALSKELKRPLTAQEKIDVEKKVDQQGSLSAQIFSPASSSAESDLTISGDSTIESLSDQVKNLKDVGSADSQVSKLTKQLIKDLFIREIKSGKTIYGATSNAQKNKDATNKLVVNKKGQLEYSNGKPLPDKMLSVSLKLNLDMIEGNGIRGKGVSATNHEQNFGKYHLSMPSFRKGNLVIYRPKTNSTLIARRNMSPTLTKIINQIKSTMKFDLDDYDRLKVVEQKTVDHVINLLRMDYPPKMKRALDEENWNLKQRYEILLSEINAGNGGYMVVSELKDVLGKLKENKVINKKKYDMIMSALD